MTARKTTKPAKPKPRKASVSTLAQRVEDAEAHLVKLTNGHNASVKNMRHDVAELHRRLDDLEKWRMEIVTLSFQQIEDYVNDLNRNLNKVGEAVGSWREATPEELPYPNPWTEPLWRWLKSRRRKS